MLQILHFPNYFQTSTAISRNAINMCFRNQNTAVSYIECKYVLCDIVLNVYGEDSFSFSAVLLLVENSVVLLAILKVLSQPNNIKNEWYMLLGLSQKFLPSWPQCNHLSLSPDLWEPRALLFLCHLIQTAASSQPISAASIPSPSVTVISFLICTNVCK